MSKRLIATLAAALVAMMILAGSGTSVARKNDRLKQRVAELEGQVSGLTALADGLARDIADLERDTSSMDDGRYLGTVNPSQIRERTCSPGDDATWELMEHPSGARLGC